MTKTNEAFSRVLIDAQLASQGWNTQDQNSVRYEVFVDDGTRADYVLCDRHGRSMAVIEAKRFSISPGDAAEQAKGYARQLGVSSLGVNQQEATAAIGRIAVTIKAEKQKGLFILGLLVAGLALFGK